MAQNDGNSSDSLATDIMARDPSQGKDLSMAQLRWQKPADGSDTLAIAQIRWQRTPDTRSLGSDMKFSAKRRKSGRKVHADSEAFT
jgi:hypothetical protein